MIDSDQPTCKIIHVPEDYPTIQEGIEAAQDGNTVLVARGGYSENINLLGKAITLRSEEGPDVTFISGYNPYFPYTATPVSFYYYETEDTVIDGFTLTGGGYGIFCDYFSSPTILNCTIMRNDEGGILCDYYSSPTIMNCTISENIYNLHYEYSEWGLGGITSYSGSPTITNCTITRNEAYLGCGGISSYDSAPTITNCTISENGSHFGYGGIWCSYFSYASIANCTIAENSAEYFGGIHCDWKSHLTMTNCILWGNSGLAESEIVIMYDSSLTIGYSDVQGGEESVYVEEGSTLVWKDGNIDADPLFALESDYHLTSGSPCIDTGTDAGIDTDIDGDSRPQGIGFDMGSDEYKDEDGDGWVSYEDCDDKDPSVYPGAYDPCDDIDQNCDGTDGFPEICDNGIDDDCDGLGDGWDTDCCDDADGDGFTDEACGGADCDDTEPLASPGRQEIQGDGIDNDCDGMIDEACFIGTVM